MHALVGPRLAVMMFLQFFIWGAWYVTAPLYLGKIGFGEIDLAWTYSVGPIAGILSPFFVGMIADRFFSTEKVLGVLHLLGAGAMYYGTTLMANSSPSPAAINVVLFVHMLCYFPTLALTNSISLQNLTDSEKQFPLIRVFGTIGWIAAGIVLSKIGVTAQKFGVVLEPQTWDIAIHQFWLATGASALLGLYCFTLPHTPPASAGKKISVREILGLDALVLLKKRSFLVFIVSSFLICIPLAFYYQLAAKCVAQSGVADPPFKMSFGQMSEIFFMVVMPFFFIRLGVKKMLLIGMLAWVVRYGLFAYGAAHKIEAVLLVGIILHGICYDFFFVTGQIYTDKVAPSSIRGQAQGMLVLFTLGLGMLIGAQVAGQIANHHTTGTGDTAVIDWPALWVKPAIAAGVVMLIFAALFRDDVRTGKITEGDVARGAAAEELP